jgi:acyl carrier protein
MTRQEIEQRVLQAFLDVAPDVDPARLDRDVAFREQCDFDSMDTLSFAIGLHQAFGIEVPETDYRELASVRAATDYLTRRFAAAGAPAS